jgi:glucose/arabinose dehydrogenase
MSLAVLPDGRVLHTARTGQSASTIRGRAVNTLVINMADTAQNPRGLYQHDEEGLQGIAVDPNFEDNHWVYIVERDTAPNRRGRSQPPSAATTSL